MRAIFRFLNDFIWLYRMRLKRWRAKKRSPYGECPNCGNTEKHKDWCWGPSLLSYIWMAIKNHRWDVTKYIAHLYRENLYWAGVAPWHRY